MDLRKSFKSRSYYKQIKNPGEDHSGNSPESEKLPVLYEHERDHHHHHHHHHRHSREHSLMASDHPKTEPSSSFSGDRRPGEEPPTSAAAAGVRRDSSYKFWQQRPETSDTASPAIVNRRSGEGSGSFDFMSQGMHTSNGEIALDVDTEAAEDQQSQPTDPVTASIPRSSMTQGAETARVSFGGVRRSGTNLDGSKSSSSSSSFSWRTSRTNMMEQREEDEVVRCTSNMSFQRKSELTSRVKTRSRLQDPPPQQQREEEQRYSGWNGRSGQLRSGFLGKPSDEEEDDPLADEDVPEEYKKGKLDAITVLEWLGLILIIAALACSLSIRSLKKVAVWNLHLWKWVVFLLALICGRLVSDWAIRIAVFFIERNFLLRKRVLYFVYGLRRGVCNCIWLGLVLLTWHFLFDKKVQRETKNKFLPYVTKILVCFLIGNLLWLMKTLVVKVLASSFHVSTYFDRIQEALFNQYVIETLSGPPMIEMSRIGEEEEQAREEMFKMQNAGANITPELSSAVFPPGKSGRTTLVNPKLSPMLSKTGAENGITIDHLHRMNHKNVSAWNMKRLVKIVRKVSLTTLDEQVVENPYEDDYARQIRNEKEAKAAARKIFKNVAQHGAKHIYLDDLMRFLREDEAVKAMSLFEGASETKKISKAALKNWLVNAFRERRALALTLNDTKTAVNKLHRVVNILAAIAIAVICLIILEIASSKFLLFMSSQVVLLAFIFGNTVKTIFESIIFLFFVHPYDVGDRCEIDGVQLVVEEMNILTTVFLRYDNLKVLYPNSVLWQKSISNHYRSPDMGDAVEFFIHVATPAEKITAIRQRITAYIDSNPEYWYPTPLIIMKDLEDLTKVRIAIWPTHKMNFQDMGERFERRQYLIDELIKIFAELDIQYRLYPIDINVRTMPTVVSARVPPDWSLP